MHLLEHQRVPVLGYERHCTAFTDVGTVKVRVGRWEEGLCETVFFDELVGNNPEDLCPNFANIVLKGMLLMN